MIDRASAKAMALKYVDENFGREPELAIVDGEPSETTHAWVFFSTPRRYSRSLVRLCGRRLDVR